MTTVNQIIINNILRLRKEQGLSQKGLADILGITQQTVYHYESGRRQVPTWCLDVLCRHFGLAPSYFMQQSEDTGQLFEQMPLRLQEALFSAASLPPEEQEKITDYIGFIASRYGDRDRNRKDKD